MVLQTIVVFHKWRKHKEYQTLPKKSATNNDIEQSFHFVYPADGSIVSIPKQMDGTKGSIVCQAVHNSSAELFWHLDGSYIGTTSDVHKMQIKPSLGYHTITVVDDLGAQKTISIIVK